MQTLAVLVALIAPLSAAPQPMTTDDLASVAASAQPAMRITAAPDGKSVLMRALATTTASLPGVGNIVADTGLRSVSQAQTSLAVRVTFTPAP